MSPSLFLKPIIALHEMRSFFYNKNFTINLPRLDSEFKQELKDKI